MNKVHYTYNPTPAMESIHQQKRENFRPLDEFCHEIVLYAREGRRGGTITKMVEEKAESVFRELFNLKVEFLVTNNDSGPSIEFRSHSPVSLLRPAELRRDIMNMVNCKENCENEQFVKDLSKVHSVGKKKIGVDMHNAKLRCKYGDVAVTIRCGVKFLSLPGITPTQVASTMCHEVGHIFNDIIYSTTFDSHYVNLSSAASDVRKIKQGDKNFSMAGLLGRHKVLTSEQVKELNKSEDTRLPLQAVTMVYNNFSESLLKMGATGHESEKLADTFAARCGYGIELAHMFNDFDSIRDSDKSFIGKIASFFLKIIKAIAGMMFFVAVIFILSGVLMVGIIFALVLTVMGFFTSFLKKDSHVHPADKDRSEFLIQDVIQRAKASDWEDKKELDIFITDMRSLDKAAGGLSGKDSFFSALFHPRARRHHKDIARLFNNSMFLDAMELKLLTMR